jgi:hypothetical protein
MERRAEVDGSSSIVVQAEGGRDATALSKSPARARVVRRGPPRRHSSGAWEE